MDHGDVDVPLNLARPGTPLAGLSLRPAVKVEQDVSIQAAAVLTRDENVSTLVVRSVPESFVSERDLTRAVAEGVDLGGPVTLVATRTPVWAPSSANVAHAAALMVRMGLRDVVVVAESGEAFGVLSIQDAFAVLLADPGANDWLADFQAALGELG